MTYNELRESIKSDTASTDPAFLSEIDTFIKEAESIIWSTVRMPAFTSTAAIQLSQQDETSQFPIDFLSCDYLKIQGFPPLEKKDAGFIRELYPDQAYGRPKFFAIEDDVTILWGPAPDQDYVANTNYYCTPKSIIDARDEETYTSIKFPVSLLEGSKMFAFKFLRDLESMNSAMDLFQKSLGISDGFVNGQFKRQSFDKSSAAVESK